MKTIKIFPASRIKEIDRLTMQKQNISSVDLMERAVDSLLPVVLEKLKKKQKVLVFSGVGNNGGDGLVLARKLKQKGFRTEVIIVRFSRKESEDFRINLERLNKYDIPVKEFDPAINIQADVIIDAIFGVGLNRPAAGIAASAIAYINGLGIPVYAIDMPSGLFADKLNAPGDAIVKTDWVFTFQFPKRSFLVEENYPYVPSFEIIDIGLDRDVIESMPATEFFVVNPGDTPRRNPFSAKWDFGHALIIGGSHCKAGAVGFAASGAYYAGAGWTSVYVPEKLVEVLQAAFPEIMCMPGKGERYLEEIHFNDSRFTIALGPGLGTEEETILAVSDFIKKQDAPLVLDADALRIAGKNQSVLKNLPAGSILTPHQFEFETLAGKSNNSMDRWEKATEFSNENRVILVLKGRYTLITDGKNKYFNSTGNPALAKAGSGDILTGMITGFLAQGFQPLQAAIKGVWLHGKIADMWVESHDEKTLSPYDMIGVLKKMNF